MIKALVVSVIGAGITGFVAWASATTEQQNAHESRISVMESRQQNIEKSLEDIRAAQLRIENKLDAVIREGVR